MKVLTYIGTYALWLVNALFGIWLVYISRNTWLFILNQYYVNESPTRANRAVLFDRVLSVVLGLAWFILVIIIEPYFRNSIEKGDLMRRFARGTGPLVLAIFTVDLILSLTQGLAIVGWFRLLIILIELVLGIVLIRFGWTKKIPMQQASDTN